MTRAMEPGNIWILNHYAGTGTSPSTRHYDLSRELVKRGHRVTIFAAGFNYQKLVEERLSPGETSKTEDHEGVRFVWLRTFPYLENSWRRAVNMLSYAWRVINVAGKLDEKPDAIIGSTIHPLAAVAGYILARRKRSRFIFEVRDLWPQSLIDIGALTPRHPATWVLREMERFLYRKAQVIITLLPYADRYIAGLGVPKEKVVWIPNGADLARYENIRAYEGGTGERFTIMYLGAHGKMNALDSVIDAAEIVQQRGLARVRFVFVGGGPEKKNLIDYAQRRNVANVEFREIVPKNEIFKVMSEADAFVFNLEDLPFNYGVSSNKLFDYLASARPILFSGNTANNPVSEAGAGFSLPPRSPDRLADAVSSLLMLTPEERIEMGKRGFAYMKNNHDIRQLAVAYERVALHGA
ncbi:MAG: glycosyltransferase family 4 protein [Thermoanaerobaculia bacterium]